MAKRLSVVSVQSTKPPAARKQSIAAKGMGQLKLEDSAAAAVTRPAPDKKMQELIKRRNEILAHRKREEEWFKIQFQLMANAWDNLEAEDDTAQTDQKLEEDQEDKAKEEPEMREIPAEIVGYRMLDGEKRVYICGGLRQVFKLPFSMNGIHDKSTSARVVKNVIP